ncbi:hypothetical protein D9613_000342 [Agrocybe pediades]|uniref:Uncharacterized protein n=1 Tax=Agrocybe pediades TaxID=84607 RepID=A0A8H4VSA3_9AGAR|nr:hypothetical protein D9613_000342 [Agrocybe pediades]
MVMEISCGRRNERTRASRLTALLLVCGNENKDISRLDGFRNDILTGDWTLTISELLSPSSLSANIFFFFLLFPSFLRTPLAFLLFLFPLLAGLDRLLFLNSRADLKGSAFSSFSSPSPAHVKLAKTITVERLTVRAANLEASKYPPTQSKNIMGKFFGGRPQVSEILQDDTLDPLSAALEPPEGETIEEAQARRRLEEEAKKKSMAIDEELNRQRLELKRSTDKYVRIMLLGQSESGKSTTLKNFQLMSSAKYFSRERASWRAVIQFNVVRSVRIMLDAINDAYNGKLMRPPTPSSEDNPGQNRKSRHRKTPSIQLEPQIITAVAIGDLDQELLKIRMRLLPLKQIEAILLRKLTPAGSVEFEATQFATPDRERKKRLVEVAVPSTTPWKSVFGKLIASARASMDSAADIDFNDPNDPGFVLNACADDILRLWEHPTVRKLLEYQRTPLESMGGFFLDCIHRVTSLRYVPTDDDILRARLKTLGVSQHDFILNSGGNLVSNKWRVYDVGGARSLRGERA